jgi:predicted MPP superfamily phosphohydrolase
MNLRFAMILTAILALFVYVGWKLAESFGRPVTVIVMLVLFAGLFFYRKIHALKNRKLRLLLVNAVHLEMGFLSFLLTWMIARDVLFIPLGFTDPALESAAYSTTGTAIVIALSLVTLAAGVFIASAGPWVVRVTVPVKGLPPDLDGFTIAQLSDMHIGPTTHPETVERIVRKTLDLNPRVIALTGDIGDGPVEESKASLEKLRELARVPAFYVTGNHEYYWNGPEWIATFSALGLKPLLNAYAVIRSGSSEVMIVGTPDPTARTLGRDRGPDVARAVSTPIAEPATTASSAFKILMAHQPGISSEARDAGIGLQLSGHTHAGQFFPWTLVVKKVHEFSKGLGRTGSLWVYVNPGTGSWGPQVRLGTKTEITLLTLAKDG